MTEPSDENFEVGLEALRERLAREGKGELDGHRVRAALTQIVEFHRERDSVLMQVLTHPTAHWLMRPNEDDPMIVEVRLGVRLRGNDRSVHAAHLRLAELLRGPTG
jgi:hypothetical protein